MTTKSIINMNNDIDYSKEPLFFGESLSIQRYDKPKYEKLFNMFKQHISYFLRPEEIDLSKDKMDFATLQEHEKLMFTTTLKYQTLLDSAQSRGISHLLEYCSNAEIEAFAKTLEFFETLHSYSYTYIIKQVYTNSGIVFDNILNDEEIIKRTVSVTKYYDDMINQIKDDTEYNKKKKLYLTLISINILEGIRFYVSFACSYCFAQNKKMEGNAKIIGLINRDENLHMGFTTQILKILNENKEEGFQDVIKDCNDIVLQMYKDAANEEMELAKYLFKDGSMIGLNAEILIQYMKYLTNHRMKMVNLQPIFEKTNNPISLINNLTESKNVQNAPQEVQIDSYVIGAFKQDMNNENYDEFQL